MKQYSPTEWAAFLGAVAAVITALLAGFASVLAAVKQVHLSINSRMDELVAATREASLAEGRDQMRDRGGAGPTGEAET